MVNGFGFCTYIDTARSNLENAVILAFKVIGVNPNEGDIDKVVALMAQGPQIYANDMFLFAKQVASACKG